ncbi:hypothetical protein PsYK624_000770 [Phanerochaete sordida]|uniref:Uncharacterized protein n=1 Tax=Phanerochaete sordida TaxID=48140 RepID=A0A9P3FVS8_9APHY|nr:hypothetical protein PsYK624_000770 [Phanerochaete sordida]
MQLKIAVAFSILLASAASTTALPPAQLAARSSPQLRARDDTDGRGGARTLTGVPGPIPLCPPQAREHARREQCKPQ